MGNTCHGSRVRSSLESRQIHGLLNGLPIGCRNTPQDYRAAALRDAAGLK